MSKLTTIDKLIDVVGLTQQQAVNLYYSFSMVDEANQKFYVFDREKMKVYVYKYPLSEIANAPIQAWNLDNY